MGYEVPAPDFRKLTDEEVWERLHTGMVDSPNHAQAKLTLQLRNLERQTNASNELVAATQRLADFTKGLRFATWALVGVTSLLFLGTAAQVYLTLAGN